MNNFDKCIRQLNLSKEALGCLKNAGIFYLEDLAQIDLVKLNKICFMNQSTVDEICQKVEKVGIIFGENETRINKDIFFKVELDVHEDWDDEDVEVKEFIFYGLDDTDFAIFCASYKEGKASYHFGDEFEEEDDLNFVFINDSFGISDYGMEYVNEIVLEENVLRKYLFEQLVNSNIKFDRYSISEYLKNNFDEIRGYIDWDSYSDSIDIIYNQINKIIEEIEKNGDYEKVYKGPCLESLAKNKKEIIAKGERFVCRIKLFVNNELKLLRNKNEDVLNFAEGIAQLEKCLQCLNKFPELYYDDCVDEAIYSFEHYFNIDKDGLDVYELCEKFLEYSSKNYEISKMSIDKIFDMLPEEYVNDCLYDKVNFMDDKNDVSFLSNFVKVVNEIGVKPDGNKYETKEIIEFLRNKVMVFNKSFVDSMNVYEAEDFYSSDEEEDILEEIRRGRR